jgi:hypothetical protein
MTGTFREAADALANLAGTFDVYTCTDIGPALTCREADAMVNALIVGGNEAAAGALIGAHARSDEIDDEHWPMVSA